MTKTEFIEQMYNLLNRLRQAKSESQCDDVMYDIYQLAEDDSWRGWREDAD